MEKKLLILFILTFNAFYGQSDCDNANSDLIYAYSHVKSAYESNNKDHLKHYSNRSKETFERAKKNLKKCGCETAYNMAYDAVELLSKVEPTETFEDGRFYVKQVRDIAQKSITKLDKCTVGSNDVASNTNDALTELEMEQKRLQEQQEALKRKSEELKAKMAEQNEMALKLRKEELANSYRSVIASNIETYNNSLKTCNCNHEPLKVTESEPDIYTISMEAIKSFYMERIKKLTSNYLSQLNACD